MRRGLALNCTIIRGLVIIGVWMTVVLWGESGLCGQPSQPSEACGLVEKRKELQTRVSQADLDQARDDLAVANLELTYAQIGYPPAKRQMLLAEKRQHQADLRRETAQAKAALDTFEVTVMAQHGGTFPVCPAGK